MKREKAPTSIYIAYDDDAPFDRSAPEKTLLQAVLMSALSDLNKAGSDRRKAMEYFLDPDEQYLFSFRSVCEFLSLDPNKVLVVAGLKATNKLPPNIPLEQITFDASVKKN